MCVGTSKHLRSAHQLLSLNRREDQTVLSGKVASRPIHALAILSLECRVCAGKHLCAMASKDRALVELTPVDIEALPILAERGAALGSTSP